jgi:hypothetical protein
MDARTMVVTFKNFRLNDLFLKPSRRPFRATSRRPFRALSRIPAFFVKSQANPRGFAGLG